MDQRPVEINYQPRARADGLARGLTSAATAIPVLGAVIAIAAFVWVAWQRIPYPFELDWLESGMLEHVRRLVDGQPIYTRPSIDFVQYPYAPLSFGVGTVFAEIFGVHFWVMRAISFGSILGVFGLIFWIVNRETKNRGAAIIAVGTFAATYKLTGTWFEVGKADSLFLFVTLLATVAAYKATTHKMATLAGVLMVAAVFTKQTAIFAFAPIAVYLLLTRFRVGLTYAIVSLVVGGGVTYIFNALSNGWYNYFVWELLFQHELAPGSKLDFLRVDLRPFWPAAVLILLALPQLVKSERRWSTGYWVFALGGFMLGSWSSRLHSGGSFNVLMPAFASMAIAGGIAVGLLLTDAKSTIKYGLLGLAALTLCSAQLWFLRYSPSEQLPSAADKQVGEAFMSWLKSVDGDVFIYSHPEYAAAVGKASFASQGGSEDVLRGRSAAPKADFEQSMATAIHDKRFAAIILDGDQDTRGFPADWQTYYHRVPGSLVANDNLWKPPTLYTGHPDEVFVPDGSPITSLPSPT